MPVAMVVPRLVIVARIGSESIENAIEVMRILAPDMLLDKRKPRLQAGLGCRASIIFTLVSFRTHARGVRLSPRMRDRYPDEMTIVLQHQFWDLRVTEQAFEVGLSFQNISEMLLIPFAAITRFADPVAGFELQFAAEEEKQETGQGGSLPEQEGPKPPDPPSQLPLSHEERPQSPRTTADAETLKDHAVAQGEPKVISIDSFRKKS
jgi:hypothetical protein